MKESVSPSLQTNTAKCCCGQASITLKGDCYRHGVCHCDNCKKRTGSAFGISVYFKGNQVIQQRGVMSLYNVHAQNPKHDHSRFFCPHCGTTLYWVLSNFPDVIGVAGGCFVKPDLSGPTFSANAHKQNDWLALPDHW